MHDRANDAIRISASELACKVIGEGANLGVTQLGRIEAALAGIRLNTDAIDNSAGVNTSDVEVNIKIALSQPVQDGSLKMADRDHLLASLTEDVAALVLRNNYRQSLALSLAERRGPEDIEFSIRLMQTLQREGRLDRAVEFLPDDNALLARARSGRGLTRPELSVLHGLCKARPEAGSARNRSSRRSVSHPRTRRLFPERLIRAVLRRGACPSIAPRDHRDRAHQRDHRPRWPDGVGARRA